MDLNYIKKLIKILDSSNISEIEIEEEGKKVRLAKQDKASAPATAANPQFQPVQYVPEERTISENKKSDVSETKEKRGSMKDSANLYEVRSPMVGTFYRSPAPDVDPYINIGDTVTPGSVLCIIEAMKLMNEIESEVSGKIVKILVENSQPVEYNQPLFVIETV